MICSTFTYENYRDMKTRINILAGIVLIASLGIVNPVIAQQKGGQNTEQAKKDKKEQEKRQKQEQKRDKKAARAMRGENPYF
jgi:hypothetical protein